MKNTQHSNKCFEAIGYIALVAKRHLNVKRQRFLIMNFDTNKYKVWTWKNALVLHWIINPGLAFNELVLGQRVPKISLVEKSNKPLAERSFVPCPHCGTIHPGLKWSPQNHTAFKNWFGLYCDHCSQIIPCVRNLTSAILLAISFPFWIWFKNKRKEKWLAVQKEKFSKPLNLTPPDFRWWPVGLRWGAFMYVLNDVLFPLIDGQGLHTRSLITAIPVWLIGGLLFGYALKKMVFSKRNQQNLSGAQKTS